jgi:hypothetical protein
MRRERSPRAVVMRLLCALLASVVCAVAEPAKIRVLIIDGQNNHDWPPATAWRHSRREFSFRFSGVSSTFAP